MHGSPLANELDLAPLEEAVQAALASGDPSGLEIAGFGEITTVLVWRGLACKRLPPVPDRRRLEAYEACFARYLERLAAAGVPVADSRVVAVPRADGRFTAYVVQAALPAGAFLHRACAFDRDGAAARAVGEVLDLIARAVSPILGLDGQLSNWALVDGRLRYLDLSTPLLRDEAGREQLDVGLFMASLPAPVRGVARRFLIQGILDKYYAPRGVALDLLGNLLKDGLEPLLGPLVAAASARFTPAFDEREVRRTYAADARSWELLQRLRRADRFVQRRLLGRTYPFLLPGHIDRRR